MKLSKSREESVISVTRRSCKHGKCSVIGIFMLKLSSGKVLIITHWRVYEDKCSKFWGHTNLSYLLCMANINGLSLAPPPARSREYPYKVPSGEGSPHRGAAS